MITKRPEPAAFIAGAPDGAAEPDTQLRGYALRAYPDEIQQVDVLRRRRRISRNLWIREAIAEKIARESEDQGR